MFKVPFRLEKFFFWVILLQFSAIVYNLLIVPMRALVTIASILFCRKGFTPKRQFELARVTIMAVCTLILMHNTNSSVIYHWIRG